MTDHPMIFSSPMSRALRDGRKTMTRRILNFDKRPVSVEHKLPYQQDADGVYRAVRSKYAPGDRIWVRETCRALETVSGLDGVEYAADDLWIPIKATKPAAEAWVALNWYHGKRGAKVPPIHMPRWASRTTLLVESVKVERLQDISEDDARAEGAPYDDGPEFPVQKAPAGSKHIEDGWDCARDWFADLWNSLHGEDAWDRNSWVAATGFRVIRSNIDALTKEAA